LFELLYSGANINKLDLSQWGLRSDVGNLELDLAWVATSIGTTYEELARQYQQARNAELDRFIAWMGVRATINAANPLAMKLPTVEDAARSYLDYIERYGVPPPPGWNGGAVGGNLFTFNKDIAAGGTGEYEPPSGGGGVTDSIKVNDKTINFGHGARHLEGTELNVTEVNQSIANEVSKIHPGMGQLYKGQISINGITIEYTAFGVSEGIINIGTYYPIP
jgi:hypothetical protein